MIHSEVRSSRETEDVYVFTQPGGSHLWGFIISYILFNYQESLKKI